jgi:hypothetical protein
VKKPKPWKCANRHRDCSGKAYKLEKVYCRTKFNLIGISPGVTRDIAVGLSAVNIEDDRTAAGYERVPGFGRRFTEIESEISFSLREIEIQ